MLLICCAVLCCDVLCPSASFVRDMVHVSQVQSAEHDCKRRLLLLHLPCLVVACQLDQNGQPRVLICCIQTCRKCRKYLTNLLYSDMWQMQDVPEKAQKRTSSPGSPELSVWPPLYQLVRIPMDSTLKDYMHSLKDEKAQLQEKLKEASSKMAQLAELVY